MKCKKIDINLNKELDFRGLYRSMVVDERKWDEMNYATN